MVSGVRTLKSRLQASYVRNQCASPVIGLLVQCSGYGVDIHVKFAQSDACNGECER